MADDDSVTLTFSDFSGEQASFDGSINVDYTKGSASGYVDLSNIYGKFSITIDKFSVKPASIGKAAENEYSVSGTLSSFDETSDKLTSSQISLDYYGELPSVMEVSGDYQDLVLGTGNAHRQSYANNDAQVTSSPACYLLGTRLATSKGEVAVEALSIGEALITRSGAPRAIRWIGRRSYAGRFANANPSVLPICFKAGSLGENTPSRDLWVSPRHAMFLDGVLIPAEHLVNGVTITQADGVDRIDYFHIELDSHDVIFAEGALSETFVDDHSRSIFHNAPEFSALYPDAEPVEAVYCAPRVEEGFVLEAVRRRLAERAGLPARAYPADAGALRGWIEGIDGDRVAGWAQSEGCPDAPVCLDVLVDGVVVAQVVAETFRSDLLAAGIGNGHHAFEVRLTTSPSGNLAVRRSADHAELHLLPAVEMTRAA